MVKNNKKQLGEFAGLNDDMIWGSNDFLSLRDRSLVTVTALIAQGITDSSLLIHLENAKRNGITSTEISEAIIHLSFYADWPEAMAALGVARYVWADDVAAEDSKVTSQPEIIFPVNERAIKEDNYFDGFMLPQRYHLHVPKDKSDMHEMLWAGLCTFLGDDNAKWLPCYEEVAKWLSDNERRGLLCIGPCGLGKTIICTKILPVLLKSFFGVDYRTCTALEMNASIDKLLEYCCPGHIIIIDELGTEAPVTVTYGNRRKPFCELVDRAEKTGTMLIIATNLRTNMRRIMEDGPLGRKGDPYPNRIPSIEERYGVRTLDQLYAAVTGVLFRGESMRGRK